MEALIIILVIAYLLLHRQQYRRHRRAGFGVWYSLRGPFHTRWTVSRRWRA